MGRNSDAKNRKRELAKERHDDGKKGFVADSSTSESEDDVSPMKTINEALVFKDDCVLPGKAVYSGDSRANGYKKAKLALDAAKTMKNSPTINSYFTTSSTFHPPPSEDAIPQEAPSLTVKEALDQLSIECEISKSQSSNRSITPYELMRRMAIRMYLLSIEEGESKMSASLTASKTVLQKGPYAATCIREWADEYLSAGDLFHHQQGAHPKIHSLFDNPEFTELCKSWLIDIKPETRSPLALKRYIESSVLPKLSVNQTTISNSACYNYMKRWGYMYKAHTKGVYIDGHERPDVVEYRAAWVARMVGYQKFMIVYEGDNLDVEKRPELKEGEVLIVFVTHDECAFHAHDAKGSVWRTEKEQLLRKKGDGKAYMVSGFMCPCHGLFDTEFISPGKNSDGYWKSADMAKQVERMVGKFESMHPGCKGLFCFDQSSNHAAMPEDALVASRMNLNPGGKDVPIMRNGWFMRDGVKVVQTMVNEQAEPKGIKAVLVERGLWDRLRLECDHCPEGSDSCCARKIMASQPDFLEQRSLLADILEKRGHIVEFYPKFHCECNAIERVWSYTKHLARIACDFSFPNLKARVPKILQDVPISTIRAYFRRALRYVSAYALGLDGVIAEWAVKKYKSHRKVDESVEKLMEMYSKETK